MLDNLGILAATANALRFIILQETSGQLTTIWLTLLFLETIYPLVLGFQLQLVKLLVFAVLLVELRDNTFILSLLSPNQMAAPMGAKY